MRSEINNSNVLEGNGQITSHDVITREMKIDRPDTLEVFYHRCEGCKSIRNIIPKIKNSEVFFFFNRERENKKTKEIHKQGCQSQVRK